MGVAEGLRHFTEAVTQNYVENFKVKGEIARQFLARRCKALGRRFAGPTCGSKVSRACHLRDALQ